MHIRNRCARSNAFTLVEVLAVLAILAVLSAILFPVFARSKAEAARVVSIANTRNAATAYLAYLADYDDTFAPANYRAGAPGTSETDRTWVQLLLPYVKDFGVFVSPSDPHAVTRRGTPVFDEDVVPGDTVERYYEASIRVNLGYNHLYLAPAAQMGPRGWYILPRTLSQAESPSVTMLLGESVWEVGPGGPRGGGSYVVVPPCRFVLGDDGQLSDSFGIGGAQVFLGKGRWRSVGGVQEYGGLWPWHAGRFVSARIDGSAHTQPIERALKGCRLEGNWPGVVTDLGEYLWDLTN